MLLAQDAPLALLALVSLGVVAVAVVALVRIRRRRDRRGGVSVLDLLEDGVLVLDSTGRVAEANAAAPRLLGATVPPSLVGRQIDDLLPNLPASVREDGRPSAASTLARPWVPLSLPGGRTVALQVHPIVGAVGREDRVVVLRNLTAQARVVESLAAEREALRRQQKSVEAATLRLLQRNADLSREHDELARINRGLEARLHELALAVERGRETSEIGQARFQAVLDGLPDAVLVVEGVPDPATPSRLALLNVPARRFWPAPLDLGHAIRPAPPSNGWSDGAESLVQALDGVVRERRSASGVRATVKGADGVERQLALSAVPLVRGSRPAALAVLQDVTAVAAEVETRDDFLSMASHELRSPLTVIRGYVQSLLYDLTQNGGTPAAEQESNLRAIERQTSRMLGLVNDLLDVSRLESGRFAINREPTLVVEFLGRVFRDMQQATQSHRVEFDFAPGMQNAVALWDQNRIEQVIANLVQNATKYSPAGTTVEIRVAKDREVAVQVSVKDEGPGIPAEVRERVFERYYQAPGARTATGLGLGLFISREIVQAHGGRMWVESAGRTGSTFAFTLPTATELDEE